MIFESGNDSVNAAYEELNRVTTWENTGANDQWFARSHYTYDNLSRERIVSRDEEGGQGDKFDFNDRNQLSNASYDVALSTPTPTPPPGKVLPVNFNPNSFTNRASPPSPLTVYLGTQTAGAVIYYTHNGTTPVPGNGTTFKYSGSVTVPAGDDWFLKAMATKSGINSDVTTSGEYNNTNPITAPAGAPPPGGNAAATAFTAPAPRTVSYAFTAADPLNRDSVTENGVLTNYTANKLNQYSNVRGQALGYDNNFNLSDDNTHSYSFNAQNELVGVDGVTVQLVYDGLGRVLKRTINNNATIFVYDGWKVIEELDGSGNLKAYNIYGAGPDEILWRNQNGTNLIYHTDKEGNVMFLLDGAGNGIERYTYDAFGAATIMDWSGNGRSASLYQNRYMFNGKDYVAEMGLYDYRHRWYQPQLGRFLQVDPKGFDAGDENLFRYCLDDPVDRVDPEGLESPGDAAERAAERQRAFDIAVDKYKKLRPDAAGISPQEIGKALFKDGHDAAQESAQNIRTRDGHRQTEERTYAEYTKDGKSLQRAGPREGRHNSEGGPEGKLPPPPAGFSRDSLPVTHSHSHVPGSGPTPENKDVPRANGDNPTGRSYIISVGATADGGRRISIYVPTGGNKGEEFHTFDGIHVSPGY